MGIYQSAKLYYGYKIDETLDIDDVEPEIRLRYDIKSIRELPWNYLDEQRPNTTFILKPPSMGEKPPYQVGVEVESADQRNRVQFIDSNDLDNTQYHGAIKLIDKSIPILKDNKPAFHIAQNTS